MHAGKRFVMHFIAVIDRFPFYPPMYCEFLSSLR